MRIMIYFLALTILVSCSKENSARITNPTIPATPSGMIYSDLGNIDVTANNMRSLDLNKDGTGDVHLKIIATGDPALEQDVFYYEMLPRFGSKALLHADGITRLFNNQDTITLANPPGFQWLSFVSITMATRTVFTHANTRWDGPFTNASRKFLGIQVAKNNRYYNGWIELSVDTVANKMILHKSGLSIAHSIPVIAGR